MANLWPVSVEAFHALGKAGLIPVNTELLYGVMYAMFPKVPLHSFFVRRLMDRIGGLEPLGLHLRNQQPLTFADSEPMPDLSVVRGRNEDFRDVHPQSAELVIEVCVSSYEYDRSKLRAYAAAGVKECWLLLTAEKRVEVFSGPGATEYSKSDVFGPGGILRSQSIPTIAVDLDALFAQ